MPGRGRARGRLGLAVALLVGATVGATAAFYGFYGLVLLSLGFSDGEARPQGIGVAISALAPVVALLLFSGCVLAAYRLAKRRQGSGDGR